ncbi:MAG TPA: VOC family protein [Thermoanaerobaculia bacterium]|nr:VOC family protein [Thermoanaerobaculia bacterium]
MQKITPHLWFDTQAVEAAKFYTSLFDHSRIKNVTTLHDTPSGSVDMVSFEIAGQGFEAISAGPLFKFNPSISFLVSCPTKEEVDKLWGALSAGGTTLMELGEYPFSDRYGWAQDRYGVPWQVVRHDGPQTITTVLMFTGKVSGKAEEAIRFYTSLFHGGSAGDVVRYGKGEEPDQEGSIRYARFALEGQPFAAMDSARAHGFAFNEAISLLVHCETQQEIDYYWERLSADPKAEQCGWLKDKYGLSWQVAPTAMEEMLASGDPKKIARVTAAFLKMKKFDLAKLREAYDAD